MEPKCIRAPKFLTFKCNRRNIPSTSYPIHVITRVGHCSVPPAKVLEANVRKLHRTFIQGLMERIDKS